MAYILTGSAGFCWLIFWFWLYDTPAACKRLSRTNSTTFIATTTGIHLRGRGLDDKAKVSWWRLFSYRQTWSFFFSKFLTDGIWWFYLFWLPDYLKKQFGMTKHEVMLRRLLCTGSQSSAAFTAGAFR